MNDEQLRAEFEAACAQHAEDAGYEGHERLEREGAGYADSHTQAAWWGWYAAMQSQDREYALESENVKLREALEMMVEMVEMNGFGGDYAMDVARAALAQKQEEKHDYRNNTN